MLDYYKVYSMTEFDDDKVLLPRDIISLCGIVLQEGQSDLECIMYLLTQQAIPQPREGTVVSWLLGDIRAFI